MFVIHYALLITALIEKKKLKVGKLKVFLRG